MSRNTKWKLEKAKVKVVFRLQFQATHIPQTGWNNLFISFIPSDSGKATAKTNKANVRNGTCKWADPIYESTRLLQDSRTKQYEEKNYKLVVAMGTSRSSLLGEANINLSDYVDASKPTVVALHLHGSDSGAILHVTVQLLTSKTGFREFEQQREVSDRGLNTNADHDCGKPSALAEPLVSRADKVNTRVRFKPEHKELPSLEEESGLSEEYADSAAGFDGSSNTSGSLYAEKHDNSSTREIDSVKSTLSGDLGGVSPIQSPTIDKEPSDHHFLVHGTSDRVRHWGAENSVDSEMVITYEEKSRLRGALEAADLSIYELRQEIISLQNFAGGVGVEAQKLKEQLSIEICAEQELVKEVSLLKSECSRMKNDLEWLRNLKINPPTSRRRHVDADQCSLLQDLSLRWRMGLSDVEDKICQLQKKVFLGSDGKDMMFLHSDLEALLSVLLSLKQATEPSAYQLDGVPIVKTVPKISEMSAAESFGSDIGLGVELCHPEGVLLPGLLAPEAGSIDATSAMQGEIFKLLRELEESKAERETLTRKMDQMECYYEALIQELEENQKQILGELQNLRAEHSSCIYSVSSTKAQMEAMHQQMNSELLQLAEERCNLDAANKELERRATTAEAALRRARLNYSIAVNQLQKDLEVLSLQVLSMYETNENLIRKTLSETSQPLLQGCEETELADHVDENLSHVKLLEFEGLPKGVKNQHPRDNSLLKDLQSSLDLQEELYRKIQEELSEMHLTNLHLDVFSVTLHQSIREASLNGGLAKAEMHEFAKQLELSYEVGESLKLKLQNMTNEICTLSEEKTKAVSRCNDLGLENKKLEMKLKSIADEKYTLRERIGELEPLVTEYNSYKRKYEDCNAEKGKFATEISMLQEEVTTMKIKLSENENLLKIVNYVRERLANLLAYGDERVDGSLSHSKTDEHNIEFEGFMSIVMNLEECHNNFHEKILQLMEEKSDILKERDTAQVSVARAESEVEALKLKFQCVPDIISKLDAYSNLVEKLQSDLDDVSKRLQSSSEAEGKYTQMTEYLLSDFSKIEAALQDLISKNKNLADEVVALGSVTDELEGKKLIVDKIKHENLSLTSLLQNKCNESDVLRKELDNSEEIVGSLQDELSVERGIRDQLEAEILNLNNHLKDRDEKLVHLDQQEELNHLMQQLSDMKSENSSLHSRLSYLEAQLKKALEEHCTGDEELLDMHGQILAEDIAHTVVVKQYRLRVAELLEQLDYYHQHLQEAYKKNLDLASMFSNCLTDKEDYAERNARLLLDLESLRSDLESSVASNRALEQSNIVMATELDESRKKHDLLEASFLDAKTQNKAETEQNKRLTVSYQFENDNLIFLKEELEIRVLVLQAAVSGFSVQINCHRECREELAILQRQCTELTRKLSEQVLKTEEFKNLSIHLKELKDKADAEHSQSRELRDAEGPSVAMQESLRIAFIKEQYETKLQEVRRQLSISKKHSEEMLWKLQDARNELEDRRKCEASQLKTNEELLSKISELEAELQSVLSDNREKFMAYEHLKAELDCSAMSLECCMEEKKQLMAAVQECNDEKCRLADEVELLRDQLMNLQAFIRRLENKEHVCHNLHDSLDGTPEAADGMKKSSFCSREGLMDQALKNTFNVSANPLASSTNVKSETASGTQMNAQGAVMTEVPSELSGIKDSESLVNDVKHEALLSDQLRPQSLLSSINRLQKELERMRSGDDLLPGDEISDELDGQGMQSEQVRLENVSEELESMSSLYNDSSRTGNSVERVLALELELAEALQTKKKSSVQFQSSFLKLHSDEAAVFQSFRDINELIKDMLEMKERYNAMESELKEIHGRYSQLSLDFAEVEGDRQKLMMMLKNSRSPRRFLNGQSPTP